MPLTPEARAARDAVEVAVKASHSAGSFSEAATRALEGYGPEILGYLSSKFESEAEAGEVFAEFCLDLWKGISGFAWRSSFRTWAYVLANHAALRHQNDPQRRRLVALDDHPELLALEAKIRSNTQPFRRTDIKEQVRALRNGLSPADQELLTLRIDKELSWDDVTLVVTAGEALDAKQLSRRTVALRKRFERLKSELRERAGEILDRDAE